MINVPSEVITQYLTDSVNKEIVIESDGYNPETLNYYTGDLSDSVSGSVSVNFPAGDFWAQSVPVNAVPVETNLYNYFHIDPLIDDWNYLNVSFYFKANSVSDTSLMPNDVTFDIHFEGASHSYGTSVSKADVLAGEMVCISVARTPFLENLLETETDISLRVWLIIGAQSVDWSATYSASQMSINYTRETTVAPEVWEASPDFSKTVRLNRYVINNDNLVYEDFTLTESLCSRDNIKFGLCESANIEFSEIGIDSVKVGDTIRVSSALPDYPVNIPNYAIEAINWTSKSPTTSSSNNSSWNMYYAVLLFSQNDDLTQYYDDYFDNRYIGYQFSFFVRNVTATPETPGYFKLRMRFENEDGNIVSIYFNKFYPFADIDEQSATISGVYPSTYNGRKLVKVKAIEVGFYKSDKTLFSNGDTISADFWGSHFQVHSMRDPWDGTGESPIPAYNPDSYYIYNGTLDDYLAQFSNKIPLGVFEVASVSNEYKHNIIKKKITAYDNLLTLEDNAADWYTRYMFGVDTDGWVSNGFEFARQIYSSYWNYVSSINLDARSNYRETRIAIFDYFTDIKPNHLSSKYLSWTTSQPINKLRYAEFSVTPDPSKLYMVSFVNSGGGTDEETINLLPSDYFEQVDSLGRGVATNGSILVWETRSDGTTAGFCVNKNDYFMISPECTALKIYVVAQSCYSDSTPAFRFLDSLSIYTVETKPELTNGHLRLCYYNYGTKEIFKCESSITGRDVVRSLLEVCGCFFRLDRYNGLPEFVYPTKGGLYPSNTLYPADDLYPRAGTDQLYPMGKYISVIAENYEVKNYGRIQILKKIKSSDTQSVVEWQYEGDPDSENTYIIDDNIFYCAEEMEYDYDGMPEVADMLEGMWLVISNLGYVPNTTQALGAPWLECGDRVGLLTYDGGFETFVFRRTLKGIQNLRDTYESEGDELTPAISNFGYSV